MVRINTQIPVLPPVVMTGNQGKEDARTQEKLTTQAAITGGAMNMHAQEAMSRDIRREMAERIIAHKQAEKMLQRQAEKVIAATRKGDDSTSGQQGGRKQQKDKQQSGQRVPVAAPDDLDELSGWTDPTQN